MHCCVSLLLSQEKEIRPNKTFVQKFAHKEKAFFANNERAETRQTFCLVWTAGEGKHCRHTNQTRPDQRKEKAPFWFRCQRKDLQLSPFVSQLRIVMELANLLLILIVFTTTSRGQVVTRPQQYSQIEAVYDISAISPPTSRYRIRERVLDKNSVVIELVQGDLVEAACAFNAINGLGHKIRGLECRPAVNLASECFSDVLDFRFVPLYRVLKAIYEGGVNFTAYEVDRERFTRWQVDLNDLEADVVFAFDGGNLIPFSARLHRGEKMNVINMEKAFFILTFIRRRAATRLPAEVVPRSGFIIINGLISGASRNILPPTRSLQTTNAGNSRKVFRRHRVRR